MIVKNMTARQIIEASKHVSIGSFTQAEEIAMTFQDEKMVYVPQGEQFLGFWKMIAAIWYGGYIAGVQSERDHRKSAKSAARAG